MKANTNNNNPVTLGGEPLEETDSFKYLGSIINKSGGTEEDVKARIQKARVAFLILRQIWKAKQMVSKKIKAMKDNKSSGVCGIPPKLLMETVEQISISLARVFNLSLKEGVVPFEWKEANIIPLFKKGSRNKSIFEE